MSAREVTKENNHHTMIRQLNTNAFKGFLSIALALIFAYILSLLVDLREAFQLFRNSDLQFVIIALLFYVFSYTIRSIRIKLIHSQERINLGILWRTVALHNFLNYILPAKSGDLSLIYLLRKRFHISIGTGAGIWITLRVFDLLTSLMCLSASVLIYTHVQDIANQHIITPVLVIISAANLILILILPMIWSKTDSLFVHLQNRFTFLQKPIFNTVQMKIGEVGSVLYKNSNPSMFARLTLTSALIWVGIFGFYWAILQAAGINYLSIPEVIIGASGAIIVNFLPINSFASIGTLQAGWVAGFMIIGMSESEALTSGIVMHIWLILFAATLALGSLFIDLVTYIFRSPKTQ